MNFRTEIQIKKSQEKICHKQKILLLGSCFAQNMQVKFAEGGFEAMHPFGAIYNPYSVANSFKLIAEKQMPSAESLFFQKDKWNSYAFHSSYSSADKNEAIRQMSEAITNANDILNSENSIIIITLGTSWVYELNETGEIVANCHHSNASSFTRRAMDVEEIIEVLKPICQTGKRIIFTVSPVRHLKDGAHENQLSKSRLLLAVDKLVTLHPNCEYFPSYEIVLDELRDYRFFAEDMAHPTALAVDYIWEKFSGAYFSDKTIDGIKEYEKIVKTEKHRPSNPESEQYISLLEKIKNDKINWTKKFKF